MNNLDRFNDYANDCTCSSLTGAHYFMNDDDAECTCFDKEIF